VKSADVALNAVHDLQHVPGAEAGLPKKLSAILGGVLAEVDLGETNPVVIQEGRHGQLLEE
jgi:hypothetical protein